MAKKVRKPRASSPRTYSQSPSAAAAPAAAPVSSSATKSPGGKSSNGSQAALAAKNVELSVEYAVVGSELRRLLITAAVMFAVLIVINLVLTFVIK